MSEMGDMKFTTAGDMMKDLPTLLESWAQNEEMVASGVMTEHGHDCMLAASKLRDMRFLINEYDVALLECHTSMDKMRDAIRDLAKHVWRGDWDKLHPETRALVGEK
jgi:hypothetical protein